MKVRYLLILSTIALIILFFISKLNNNGKLVFCDVGQGDSTLLSYGNVQLLIDSGPTNMKVLRCLNKHVPFWDKRIEVLILTHMDLDHSGGVTDILKSYKIGKIFSNEAIKGENEQNIYSYKLVAGDILKLGKIVFEVKNPEANSVGKQLDNDDSIVGILSYEDKSFLMLGDISGDMERRMVWRKLIESKIDVVKISHHGSATATTAELLDYINPRLAVISVGKQNTFGHPTKEVLERLKMREIQIKRTDEEGEIIITF